MITPEVPQHWQEFVLHHSLMGLEIEFPWPGEQDLMACVEILDAETIELEATQMWPGIGVLPDGYIPVAGCGIGSGDQYCINLHDGANGPLYLVDHERVHPDGYKKDEAISIMLEHYEELLDYI